MGRLHPSIGLGRRRDTPEEGRGRASSVRLRRNLFRVAAGTRQKKVALQRGRHARSNMDSLSHAHEGYVGKCKTQYFPDIRQNGRSLDLEEEEMGGGTVRV